MKDITWTPIPDCMHSNEYGNLNNSGCKLRRKGATSYIDVSKADLEILIELMAKCKFNTFE